MFSKVASPHGAARCKQNGQGGDRMQCKHRFPSIENSHETISAFRKSSTTFHTVIIIGGFLFFVLAVNFTRHYRKIQNGLITQKCMERFVSISAASSVVTGSDNISGVVMAVNITTLQYIKKQNCLS